MSKKYTLGEAETMWGSTILYRVIELKDFSDVKKGTIGGYVKNESNLSQDGNCWIYNDAMALDDSRVCDNAKIKDNAMIRNKAVIKDNAYALNNAELGNSCEISGHASVINKARIYGNARVIGYSEVRGCAHVSGNAIIDGCSAIADIACISDNCVVLNATVCGNISLCDRTIVDNEATICGRQNMISGNSHISSIFLNIKTEICNANIFSLNHFIEMSNVGSRSGSVIFYRNNDNKIVVKCGCFTGTIRAFLRAVFKTHKFNKHARIYRRCAKIAKLHIDLSSKRNILDQLVF